MAGRQGLEEAPPGFVEPALWRRFLGAVLDRVITIPLTAAPFLVLRGRPGSAVALALVAVYEVAFVVAWGRTPGKRIIGTRVADATTGGRPTAEQAVRRWGTVIVVTAASLAVPVLGVLDLPWALVVFLPVFVGPFHRGLHDRAAGTVVSA